ncbi:hypothetical protein MHF_1486 [Mycoplasma haemofelis Ohio2]|uniref:Uncharacterized protein n=1 Tax=Mycoplasma haemofelis (strain Ohio2) TaxID=859194 RepID=F6FH11_MYCHI|nr:hypothetical protein MHF_1486 [Mycoplasma haemofelis Ohio2]
MEEPVSVFFLKWVRIKSKILALQLPEELFLPNQALLAEIFDSYNFPFFLTWIAKVFYSMDLNAQDLSYLCLSFQGDESKTGDIIGELQGAGKETLLRVMNRHSVNFRSQKMMNFVNSQMDYWKSNSDNPEIKEEAKWYMEEVNKLKLELDSLLGGS